MAEQEAVLNLQFYALLPKNKGLGQQEERHRLQNVYTRLTSFESPLHGAPQMATGATFSSIPTGASGHWDGSGIWVLLGYNEMTPLLVFCCILFCPIVKESSRKRSQAIATLCM